MSMTERTCLRSAAVRDAGPHGNVREISDLDSFGCRYGEVAQTYALGDERFNARLVNRKPPGLQRLDPAAISIDQGDGMSRSRQACTRYKTNVSRSEDGDGSAVHCVPRSVRA